MSKKYRVYFEQVNQQWIEVDATSPAVARRKARKVWLRVNDLGVEDYNLEPREVEKVTEGNHE